MIRFIDLRREETGYRFAFWDTTTDSFLSIAGDMAWDSFEELEENLAPLLRTNRHLVDYGPVAPFLRRLKGVTPDWALTWSDDDVED